MKLGVVYPGQSARRRSCSTCPAYYHGVTGWEAKLAMAMVAARDT